MLHRRYRFLCMLGTVVFGFLFVGAMVFFVNGPAQAFEERSTVPESGGHSREVFNDVSAQDSATFIQYQPYIYNDYYGWATILYLQNPSAITASLTLTFSGPTLVNVNKLIAPGATLALPAEDISGLDSGASYSLVISSDQAVESVVNMLNEVSPGDSLVSIRGEKISSTSDVFAPFIDTGDLNLWNVSASEASYSVEFFDLGGNHTTTEYGTIPAGGRNLLYGPAINNLPAGFYSVVISSTQELVCDLGFAYTDVSRHIEVYPSLKINSSSAYLPRAMKTYQGQGGTNNTMLFITNQAVTPTNAILGFYNADGTIAITKTQSIAGQGTWMLSLGDEGSLPDHGLWSVIANADQPIGVSEHTNYAGEPVFHNGVYPGGMGSSLQLPRISRMVDDYTIINVQNTSTTAASVTTQYFNLGGVLVFSETVSVPTYGWVRFDQSLQPQLGSNFEGSVTIDSDQMVNVLVDEYIGAPFNMPELSIGKTAPGVMTAGELISYTLTVTNSGSISAANLIITDALPTGANYVSGGVLNGGIISWTVSELPPASLTSVEFAVTATQSIVNSAYQVTADGGYSASGQKSVSTQIVFNSCDSVIGIPQSECEALVALYNGTNGGNWTDNSGWLVTNTPCDWYGVTCGGGSVSHLNLTGNNLSGTLPAAIENLNRLLVLSLDTDIVRGEYNYLSGNLPPEIGNLSLLTSLDLDGNQLEGSIPDTIGDLSNLEYLSLSWNDFSGSIPASLGGITSLKHIRIAVNQLSGSIPVELGDLDNLEQMWLNVNHLSGEVPVELGQLKKLNALSLDANQLEGSLPAALGDLTNLTSLRLRYNQFHGDIPKELANLTNVTHPYLGYNALTASDPALLAYLSARSPDWDETQTVAPTALGSTSAFTTELEIGWTPISYTQDGGFYEVQVSTQAGGGFITHGDTMTKTASAYNVDGLLPGTTYYMRVRTFTPMHGNQQNNLWSEFSEVISGTTLAGGTQAPIVPDGDTTIVYTDTEGTEAVIEIPTAAVTEEVTIAFIPVSTTTEATNMVFAGQSFELNAYQDGVKMDGFTFQKPVTITLGYHDEDIVGLDEETLVLNFWDMDTQTWVDAATTCVPASSYVRHLGENWLAVPICHLSTFGLFGAEIEYYSIFLPMIMKR